MSVNSVPYRSYPLHPTATTTYNISDFTATVLNNADEYEIVGLTAYVTCTAKSSTAFTLTVVVQSPVVVNSGLIQFLRAGI